MKVACKKCKKEYEQKDGYYQDSMKKYYQPCKKCICEKAKKKRKEKCIF